MTGLLRITLVVAWTAALIAATAGTALAVTTPGFHAAYFSESDFLARSPGQTGQFAVGYTNTGDQAWVSGAANQQANLATAAPLNNTTDFTAGWANGWLSANRYTAQNAALVAPGQIGFFIYNFTVPTNAAAGEHRFYGRPVIDGVTFMEDYGYYQSVVVTTGSVLITSSVPASPNTNPRPTLTGSGAGAGCMVTVSDGSSPVASGTSDASGNFTITTSALAVGSHALTAASTCPDSSVHSSGNTFNYTVSSGGTGAGAFVSSVSAANSRNLVVTFTQCVQPNSVGATNATAGPNDATLIGNYSGVGGITTITMNSSSQVTLFLSAPLVSPTGGSLTVSNLQACTGALMASPETVPFTFSDTSGPVLSSVTASAQSASTTTRVDVGWNEPVQCVGTYTVDGITAGVVGHPDPSSSGQTKCQLGSAQTLAAGSSHTLSVLSERDQGVGNIQSPNPASMSFTVGTTPSLTISGSSGLTENVIRMTWNQALNPVHPAGYTCASPNLTSIPCTAAAASSGAATQVDVTLTAPFSVSGCATFTTCNVKVTVTGESAPGPAGSTILENPDPQSTTATITKDTTAPTLSSATQSGSSQTLFDANWSEPVGAPQACVTTTCPFRVMSGATIIASTIPAETATSVNLTASDNTAGDSKTRLTAASPLSGGSYTLTAVAGAVKDLSAAQNASSAGTVGLSVVDSTQPTATFAQLDACTTGNPCKTFQWTFSEVMATSGAGSVLDISHYTINGSPVTGLVSVNSPATVATLTLASNAVAGPDQLRVLNVTDVAGNVTNPDPLVANFTSTP